jgi:Tfp pilus assembly protein PilF
LGNHLSSINDLKLALNLENDIEIICNLGEQYLKTGDLINAKFYLEKVIDFQIDSKEEWAIETFESLNRPLKNKAQELLTKI